MAFVNQKDDTARTDITLKPFTKSIGAEISSGLGGIKTNAVLMKTAYPTKAIIFFV